MLDTRINISAQNNASRVLADVRRDLGGVGTAAAKLGPVLSSLGVSISAGAAFAWLKGVNNGIDALNDLRDATGASIENLSALEDIGARTGTSFETVGSTLVKFNAALTAAKPGSDQAAAFKALGLSIADLKAQDPAEALRKTAVALAQFADDGNKARIVQELFGKSLREVAPFLNDLASQGTLVAKVTAEQAAAAEKFNQQLFALQKNATDAGRALVSDLLPALSKSLEILTRIKEGGLLSEVLKDAAKGVVGLERLSGDAGADINKLMKERDEVLRRIDRDRFKGKPGLQNQSLIDELEQINKLLEISRIRQKARVDAMAGEFTDQVSRKFLKDRPSLPSTLGVAKDDKSKVEQYVTPVNNTLERYLDSLDQAIEKEQELTSTQTAERRISEASANGFSQALADRIRQRAAEKDQLDKIKEAIKEAAELDAGLVAGEQAAQKAAGERVLARQRQLEALLGNTDEARTAKIRENVDILKEAFESGQLAGGIDQYRQAVQQLIEDTGKGVEKTKTLAEELGLTFTSAFENAIVGGGKLSEVIKGLGQDILRLTVRKTITEPLGGLFTNALGSLFSFDGGGYTGGGPRAGGIDGKGGFLSVLHPQESVIDHSKGGRAGASVTVNINQSVGDIATVSLLQRSNDALVRQIQGALARSQRYDGALAA